MDSQALITSLEEAPGIIIGLVHEVPSRDLKRRPAPDKWSAHEHACHMATGDDVFRARLERMLAETHPAIHSMLPSAEEQAGSLLQVDLEQALESWVRERALTVARLRELAPADWLRTADHQAFSHFSVHIMFRHLLLHEMLHTYRIEELLLRKDWV